MTDGHRMGMSHPEPGEDFNVCIIGAGGINFGTVEGPWNHSFRLEHKLGPRLKVTALVEPNAKASENVLTKKRESFVYSAYKDTQAFTSLAEYLDAIKSGRTPKPKAVVVGCPPQFHGSTTPPNNVELALVEAVPDVALFVEKPVSNSPTSETWAIAHALAEKKAIVSVGYMMRYLQVVQKMKSIIEENNLTVMATVARYVSSYAHNAKTFWWTKSQSGGPIVEQATHFCDLSRYFGGDVDIDSIKATRLNWNEEPGKLAAVPFDENIIPENERIPRVTAACWKYKSGAVGSLTHALTLQGTKYDSTLEVYCDGYQLRLVDPYTSPQLFLRTPAVDREEVYSFPDDDPYFGEIECFIDSIENKDLHHEILSTYEDAVKTYEMTWAITNAN